MNAYVVSADRRLIEALKQSGDYGAVISVSKEMIAVLLLETEERRGAADSKAHPQPAKTSAGAAEKALRYGGGEHRTPGQDCLTETVMSPGDVWVVSDEQLDIHEAVALRLCFLNNKFLYLLSNHSDSHSMKATQSLCAAHGIRYVLPFHTPEQVAGQVGSICFSREQRTSKVITAIGTLPQMGLTSSLLRIGTTLSRLSGIRVGILGLNGWNPGDSGLNYSGKYLDELWGSLQGRQLQGGELRGKMQQIATGVHYLAGNRDMKKLYYYHTDGISWLIEKARECFDLVLLDAGSYPDHALAAQSIHSADLLLVQTNQSLQAREQWNRMLEHILQPVFHLEERQTMLVFNRMLRSPEMENEKQLSRQLNMPYIGSLPQVESFYRCETERSLLVQQWPEYEKELQKVSKAILHYYDVPLAAVQSKEALAPATLNSPKGSWLRWMKPVKGA
ncbi:hypothetical protein ACFQ88_32480 [Paenibacillus sp. NPDC056579]|uniref:hypothetical protein n=1 Tax=Paenibacillus sp. NPDC056579 TaxID=3345871 RepID=UPI0036AFDE87